MVRFMGKFIEELVEIPGFHIGIKRWGPREGLPVFAFHGMLDNAASFDFLAPLLNVHLIAVDSPGCGKSSHYPYGILPQWLEEAFLMFHLVNTLGFEKFSILGHSRGTIIGLIMAVADPERVKSLAILEALGPPEAYSTRTAEFLRKALENYLNYETKPKTLYPDLDAAIKERMNIGKISYESARALVERGTEKTEKGYVWTYDRRLRSMQPSFPHNDHVNALLEHLEVPTCLIKGKEGLRYPKNVLENRKSLIKNLEVHEVPGGHHLHMDNPEPVAEILEKFYIYKS